MPRPHEGASSVRLSHQPDAQHHALDVHRVRTDQGVAEGENMRLGESLVMLDLRIATDSLVRRTPPRRIDPLAWA